MRRLLIVALIVIGIVSGAAVFWTGAATSETFFKILLAIMGIGFLLILAERFLGFEITDYL